MASLVLVVSYALTVLAACVFVGMTCTYGSRIIKAQVAPRIVILDYVQDTIHGR